MIGLIATGSFESVLVYAQVPLLLCLILGVAGVIVLRKKARRSVDHARDADGFRCPLYPLPPLIFILCTLAGLIYSALNKPWVALAGLGTMILPLVLYPLLGRKSSNP